MDGMLSQEEINALLSGMNTEETPAADTPSADADAGSGAAATPKTYSDSLSDAEKDAISHRGRALRALAEAIGDLL